MKRNDGFVMQSVGGDYFLVPIGKQVTMSNGMILLNHTAQCLWLLLDRDRSVSDLVIAMAEKFHIEYEYAYIDITAFINEGLRIGIILV